MNDALKIERKPWLLLVSVYVTQYMGIAFIIAAAVAIMRQQGVALDRLAQLNLIALPIAGKILYAPFIDRYRPFFRGQYRSWLIIAQALMAVTLVGTGMLDIQKQFSTILLLLMVYGFAVSVQDVAVDGLSCKIFEAHRRQQASSLQYASNLVGNIVGGGVLLLCYPWLQWQGALWVLAALTTLTCLQLLFFTEPPATGDTTAQARGLSARFRQLGRDVSAFIGRQRRWFLLLLVYPVGFASGFALLNPMLVDAGWSLGDIGFATKVVGSLVGVFSALMASPLINWLGRKRALLVLTLAQAVGMLLMLPVALGLTDKLHAYLAIAGYFAVNPALLAVLATLIMDRAAQAEAKATFFTLQISLVVFMGFAYSALGMIAAKHVGYFLVVVATVILTSLMVWVIGKSLPAERGVASMAGLQHDH